MIGICIDSRVEELVLILSLMIIVYSHRLIYLSLKPATIDYVDRYPLGSREANGHVPKLQV